MTLCCAAARVLYRVSLLRSPVIPPAFIKLAERVELLEDALPKQIRVSDLVPLAHVLCAADPDGAACDEALSWLSQQPDLDPQLVRARQARAQWISARSCVVQANLRLGASVVHRAFSWAPMPMEDLFQEAVFGLTRAADRFDPNRGIKFSTYATWWIRHALQRALHNTMRTVRLPSHVCEAITRLNIAQKKLGEDASIEDLATFTSFTVARCRKMLDARRRLSVPPVSLDSRPHNDPAMPTRVDMLEAEHTDLDDLMFRARACDHLEVLLEDLPPRVRTILVLRYGLEGNDDLTLAEIGAQLGLSRERIRQVQKGALSQLHTKASATPCSTSQL